LRATKAGQFDSAYESRQGSLNEAQCRPSKPIFAPVIGLFATIVHRPLGPRLEGNPRICTICHKSAKTSLAMPSHCKYHPIIQGISRMNFDDMDLKLLELIQGDASLTVKELAASVGLSGNACWRRIQQYEKLGLIIKRVTLLDPVKFGVGTTVFISVRAPEHSEEWLNNFSEAVRSVPEVVEFYRMAGDIDYFIKVRVSDISHYDRIYKSLIKKVRFVDVSAAFAMEEIKNSTEIPLTAPLGYLED
jgi:Lrp/AsnC family transcriptional regulator